MRLFELGVNPTLVFAKRNTDKIKHIYQITDIKKVEQPISSINGIKGKIKFILNIENDFNTLFAYCKDRTAKKIVLDEKIDSNGNYAMKITYAIKGINNIFSLYKSSKLIIKNLFKSNIIIMAGFYNGNLLFINLNNLTEIPNLNIINKLNKEDQFLLRNYGKGIITSLEVSQDEKYIVFGNDKGILVIIENSSTTNFDNNEKYLKILNIVPSHPGHIINSISINSDLNLFADYSYDNYVHIYALPKCNKINSVFIKDSNTFMDYLFLSAQPLASIILYSNKSAEFKCYNINGHDLNVKQNDKDLLVKTIINNNDEAMISPVMFTNSEFSDYLLYVFRNQFVLLRKMPLMDIVFKINFERDEFITSVNLSLNKEYIYVVDDKNEKVYIIKYKKDK
jgi:WD40 repeat protein